MRANGFKCYNSKCKYSYGEVCTASANATLACVGRIVHKKTIADHIRSLSDEELAKFLADEVPHGDCHNCDLECRTYREGDKFYSCCQNAFYKWLKQAYKEET